MLCAGSLWTGNGVDLLFEAMKLINVNDVELIFAGHGGVSFDQIKYRMKVDDRIKFVGMLDHDALFKLYSEVYLLLNIRLTQDLETDYLFPSKILEYLVVGKPVLSTSVAYVEEVYGDYCYILKEETAAALAKKIIAIKSISSDERFRMGLRARKHMLEEHTWKVQGQRLCDYLMSL